MAIRIEGSNESMTIGLTIYMKLELNSNETLVLENEQSKILWEKTRTLSFSNLKNNLLRIVVPPIETFEVIKQIKSCEPKYFIDWR